MSQSKASHLCIVIGAHTTCRCGDCDYTADWPGPGGEAFMGYSRAWLDHRNKAWADEAPDKLEPDYDALSEDEEAAYDARVNAEEARAFLADYEDLLKQVNEEQVSVFLGEKSQVPVDNIAAEAYRLVFGARQASYGHPDEDFRATGRIMGALLTRWLASVKWDGETIPDVPPRIVALLIAAIKLSRESGQHKRDNLVDLIGYALCAQRIEDKDWLPGPDDYEEEEVPCDCADCAD